MTESSSHGLGYRHRVLDHLWLNRTTATTLPRSAHTGMQSVAHEATSTEGGKIGSVVAWVKWALANLSTSKYENRVPTWSCSLRRGTIVVDAKTRVACRQAAVAARRST